MSVTTTRPARSTTATRALWTAQILLGLFLIVASAGPKLFGETSAVEIFTQIGIGQWFRYLVGVLELLGGVGLLIRRSAGAAALGLVGLMIGAAFTQAFVLHGGLLVLTPIVIGVIVGVIAWARRGEIRGLLG
ncbi:DoxX-like protein [Pseudonocardia sediminis]|uniref:DoxX-like protein n=1 Tax=Pseudonocardia sediminis TaxID=1397368 RepID=A0A4Q7V0X5_PSEST|nr:DoxX family protein [Pseudonocardia sediminis]RZT87755.1 DoxX-like protein [Pseudonocardia sediminis]